MPAWIIARREITLGFRNPWSYSFLILFSAFSLALVLILSNQSLELQGYTHATGMMLNLTLDLLPMMTLLLGAFSLTTEKEDGSWQLLSTYSLSTRAFLIGKYLGVAVVLLAILATGFGVFGLAGAWLGQSVTLRGWLTFSLFSIAIMTLYLALAVVIGAVAKNRWQALTLGVGVWFVTVLAWPTLLVAGLNLLPYPWIKPTLGVLTLLNPAELVRVVTVIKLGGGTAFGPEYYHWVNWVQGNVGTATALVEALLWWSGCISVASWIWERGRRRV